MKIAIDRNAVQSCQDLAIQIFGKDNVGTTDLWQGTYHGFMVDGIFTGWQYQRYIWGHTGPRKPAGLVLSFWSNIDNRHVIRRVSMGKDSTIDGDVVQRKHAELIAMKQEHDRLYTEKESTRQALNDKRRALLKQLPEGMSLSWDDSGRFSLKIECLSEPAVLAIGKAVRDYRESLVSPLNE